MKKEKKSPLVKGIYPSGVSHTYYVEFSYHGRKYTIQVVTSNSDGSAVYFDFRGTKNWDDNTLKKIMELINSEILDVESFNHFDRLRTKFR